MARRLLLWDIDGTLLHGDGVGGKALNDAAAAIAQLAEVPVIDMHGKTDPQILREIFRAAEVADDDIATMLPEAMVACERALAAAEQEYRTRGRTHPGVVDVLRRLHATDGVRQTLVTGNLVGNAAVKLAAFDLTTWFDFEVGAYGTDHEDRLELVPIALDRVERLRGERYGPDEVWVVGDTERDLACARAGGVRCLLVGTGAPGWEGVRDLDADVVLPDLADVDRVCEVLTG